MNLSDELSMFISNGEKRVESYKHLVAEAFKNNDRELVSLFKEAKQDEEKALKRLRQQKTDLNAGLWTWLTKEERAEAWQNERCVMMHL